MARNGPGSTPARSRRVGRYGSALRRVALRALLVLLILFAAFPEVGAAQVADPARKVDSHLRDLAAADARGQDVAAFARSRGMRVNAARKVLVDVYVVGPAAAEAPGLRGEGMDVAATNDRAPFRIIEGWIPVQAATRIAARPGVKAVMAVSRGGTDAGGTLSQGDAAHNGPAARALGTGVTGSGVVVGVISDSINQLTETVSGTPTPGLAASQATGDLPAGVTVLLDDTSTGVIDEGRAMSEIIYDTAPGVTSFFFSSGTATGATGKANSINNLVANNVDLIADDIFYLTEPFFQDGQVAQAVDNARANGVAYFASAGNRARQSYEATYADNGGLHDFDPTAGVDTRQNVVAVPNGAFFQLVLQWAEPWGAATTDLNARLVNAANGNLLVEDTTDNTSATGTGLPIASVSWTNNTGAAVTVALETRRAGGTALPFMKYIARGNFGTFTVAEFATNSDTINPDAASAQGSLTVAAVAWNDAGLNDPEGFSSRGLKTRLFDSAGNPLASPEVRQKPQIAGADSVATSVTGFGNFQGTSAATPSVAGVAALVLSARPTLTVAQLYSVLTRTAATANTIDCTLAGNPDTDCGFGFVLADRAVADVLDQTAPVITLTTGTDTAAGTGWYNIATSGTDGVTVTATATDPGGVANVNCTDNGTPVLNANASSGSFTLYNGIHSIACTATDRRTLPNTGVGTGSTAMPATYKIDQVAPSLSPSVSPNPVFLNGSAVASPGATDGGSGVASASCLPVDTSSVGAHTVACTATDVAGNQATAPASYTVLYKFSGFFQPVDNAPTLNTANAGQGIPLKWRLTDANDAPVGNLTNVSVRAVTVACALGTTTDQIEEVATGASGLLSQGNGNYQYNWATPKGYARSCKQMTLDLGEGGLTHNAYFQFLR